MPYYLELDKLIKRYGSYSVIGRPLSFKEINLMQYCRQLEVVYESRAQSDNWNTWAKSNPEMDKFLKDALKAKVENG